MPNWNSRPVTGGPRQTYSKYSCHRTVTNLRTEFIFSCQTPNGNNLAIWQIREGIRCGKVRTLLPQNVAMSDAGCGVKKWTTHFSDTAALPFQNGWNLNRIWKNTFLTSREHYAKEMQTRQAPFLLTTDHTTRMSLVLPQRTDQENSTDYGNQKNLQVNSRAYL